MKFKKILFSLFIGFLAFDSFSQLENKFNLYAYTGVPRYSKGDGGPAFRNVFNDNKALPYLGVGLDYGFNTHLSIGPTVRVMQTRKENVRIPNVTFGLETKYNFLANDKKVSPFIVSEVSMTNLVIRQEEVTEEEIVNTKNGNEPLKQINVTTTPVSETKIGSILGVTLGIGSDFTVKQKYGVFVSFNYMFTNAHEHAKLQEVYPENTSKYSFFLIKAGMNFGFLRSNKI